MKIYVVTLIDRETGQMEKIGVRSPNPDVLPCKDDMQTYVESGLNPPLSLKNPVVIDIKERVASLTEI